MVQFKTNWLGCMPGIARQKAYTCIFCLFMMQFGDFKVQEKNNTVKCNNLFLSNHTVKISQVVHPVFKLYSFTFFIKSYDWILYSSLVEFYFRLLHINNLEIHKYFALEYTLHYLKHK